MSDSYVYDPLQSRVVRQEPEPISDWGSVAVPRFDLRQTLIDQRVAEFESGGAQVESVFDLIAFAEWKGYGSTITFLDKNGYTPGSPEWIEYLKNQGLRFPPPPPIGRGGGGPSTADRIEGMMANMRAAALLWNVRIDDNNLRRLATTAVNDNYNQQQVLNQIGKFAVGQDMNAQIDQGPLGNAVRAMARSYGVQLSEPTIKQLLQGYVQGTETEQTITARLQQQAIAAYPALAERMKQGETFEQIINPYREMTARILEQNPDEVDFVGTKFGEAVSFNPDGKGERMMSLGEYSRFLRQNREFGYEYTTDAQNKAYQTANAIATMFGRA